MKRIVVFCSNPTDGGTAEMFVQCCLALKNDPTFDAEVLPCIDKGNMVRIFELLPDLIRLDVISEVQACGKYRAYNFFGRRIARKIIRYWRYSRIKNRNIQTMKGFLSANKIDSVLIHNGGYVGDDLCNQMLQASYSVGIKDKRVMVFHGTPEYHTFNRVRFIFYDRMINKCATDVITGSDYSMHFLKETTGIKNITVVANGISYEDTLTIEEKKRNVQYRDADVHLVNVANFYETKGQMHLLQAFACLVNNTSKDVSLTLIGHASDRSFYHKCEEYIREKKLDDKVAIADNIYNSREYMDLFDIAIVSSLGGEDLPMVPIEAMRSGIPTIAYACNGIPEEIDDSNGILVNVGDIDALARSMKFLVENDSIRNKMGKNAKMKYEQVFSGKMMGSRYIDILERRRNHHAG